MVYGYVNQYKGETEEFLKNRNVDKIVYCDNKDCDLSFLKKGDKIIFLRLKSVSGSLKDALKFAQYVFDNQIDICFVYGSNTGCNDFLDTNTAIGKMIIDIWAALNKFDDEEFGDAECVKTNT